MGGGAASSFECDLHHPSGALRRVLFHAVPLLDHPDDVASVLLSARDVTDRRRLEASLEGLGCGETAPSPETLAELTRLRQVVQDDCRRWSSRREQLDLLLKAQDERRFEHERARFVQASEATATARDPVGLPARQVENGNLARHRQGAATSRTSF